MQVIGHSGLWLKLKGIYCMDGGFKKMKEKKCMDALGGHSNMAEIKGNLLHVGYIQYHRAV